MSPRTERNCNGFPNRYTKHANRNCIRKRRASAIDILLMTIDATALESANYYHCRGFSPST